MAGGRAAAEAAAAAEGAARGAALERAYVHDVYEGARALEHAPPDERARAFLADLEPGSLVCDVGCGSGQYLSVNPSVFSLGGDRCSRLAMQAHQDNNEVVVCDNLALPYRDDSFDAVVSVAVVHHFATVERRARALRELARVTRIGGRLLLTVWAMEHEGRQFHSQDVLIPWHAPGSPPPRDAAAAASPPRTAHLPRQPDPLRPRAFLSVDNERCGEEWRWRTRGAGGDCSPGSSSLSSPNETCYSFVRRALQRLAGRRSFLHSWSFSRSTLHVARLERDDTRDARDLPIELRTSDIEPTAITVDADPAFPAQKSRSLTDIAELEPRAVSRSRSSLPGLASRAESPERAPDEPPPLPEPRAKPRLVKQKKSVTDDDADEALDEATDMRSLVSEMPDFKIHARRPERRPGVFKQSSLNEELMSTERMHEKERLRRNIQKQASLNEEYLFRRTGTLDSLRDSIFSTSATTAKRFQSLKNGLTNKLKTSTTGMDKATVIGLVKIFQGWRGAEWTAPTEPPPTPDAQVRREAPTGAGDGGRERRHSREDGSDSSKDSSLQSDTSVDSEDSFASVIFVPRADGSSQDPASPTPLSPGPTSPRLKVSSLPTSPRMKSAPALPSPRLKQFPIVRQPLSPKATQAPVQLNRILLAQYGIKSHSAEARSQPDSPPKFEPGEESPTAVSTLTASIEERVVIPPIQEEDEKLSPDMSNEELMAEINRDIEEIRKLTAETERLKPRVLQDVKPYPKITLQTVAELPEIPQWRSKPPEEANELDASRALAADRKRKERIRQVREMLRQGMPNNNNRSFPLVRRGGGEGPAARAPRLASLELFNPETDDADSDSSGVSSPDSVDSVISVVPEDLRKAALDKDTHDPPAQKKEQEEIEPPLNKIMSSSTQNLLEVVADAVQSQDETCEAVVQSSPHGRRKRLDKLDSSDAAPVVAGGASSSSSSSNWSLNKLSPSELRLLEERSRSQTSSSGSSSSLERLSPGRRSKERSPKIASTSNSTWSLNRLSPAGRPEVAASLDALAHRSPTRFPYDSLSVSSTDSEKSISKSDSFNRLQANERLVTCKSDIPGKDEEREWNDECRQHLTEFAEKLSEKLLHEIDQYSKRLNDEDFDLPSSSSSEASVSLRLKREEEARNTQKVLDDLSDSLQQLDDPYINKISFEIQDLTKLSHEIHERNRQLTQVTDGGEEINKLFPKCGVNAKTKKKRSDVDPILAKYREAKKHAKVSEEDIILNNLTIAHDPDTIVEETSELEADESTSNGNPEITVDSGAFELSQSLDTGCSIESEMSVDSFCTDKRSSLRVGHSTDSSELDKMEISPESLTSRSSAPLRSHCSIESSDTSASDWSRRERTASTASPGAGAGLARTPLQSSLSDASADSACSEGGGAGVLHRYYHVFREGELDHLIEKYVENLHVVSSYYDHSSWCVIAEKVQVWTI